MKQTLKHSNSRKKTGISGGHSKQNSITGMPQPQGNASGQK
jgi:hypothetical protein